MTPAWIKVRKNLMNDPRVVHIQHRLRLKRPSHAAGQIEEVWAYGDTHSTDGRLPHLTPKSFDALFGKGLAQAMMEVEWLAFDEHGAIIPRFHEHNGQSAKDRAQHAALMADRRADGNVRPEDRKRDGRNLTKTSPEGQLEKDGRDDNDKKKVSSGTVNGSSESTIPQRTDPPEQPSPHRDSRIPPEEEKQEQANLLTEIKRLTGEARGSDALFALIIRECWDARGEPNGALVRRIISTARQGIRDSEADGNPVRRKGAYFTNIAKTLAAEKGIVLSIGSQRRRDAA